MSSFRRPFLHDQCRNDCQIHQILSSRFDYQCSQQVVTMWETLGHRMELREHVTPLIIKKLIFTMPMQTPVVVDKFAFRCAMLVIYVVHVEVRFQVGHMDIRTPRSQKAGDSCSNERSIFGPVVNSQLRFSGGFAIIERFLVSIYGQMESTSVFASLT